MSHENVPDWLVVSAVIVTAALILARWVKTELENEEAQK